MLQTSPQYGQGQDQDNGASRRKYLQLSLSLTIHDLPCSEHRTIVLALVSCIKGRTLYFLGTLFVLQELEAFKDPVCQRQLANLPCDPITHCT